MDSKKCYINHEDYSIRDINIPLSLLHNGQIFLTQPHWVGLQLACRIATIKGQVHFKVIKENNEFYIIDDNIVNELNAIPGFVYIAFVPYIIFEHCLNIDTLVREEGQFDYIKQKLSKTLCNFDKYEEVLLDILDFEVFINKLIDNLKSHSKENIDSNSLNSKRISI